MSVTPTSSSTCGSSCTSPSRHSAEPVESKTVQHEDPLDSDCKIQSLRVSKILDSAIYKTKLAICLPLLVIECNTLSRFLKPEEFNALRRFYNDNSSIQVSSIMDMEAMEDIASGDTMLRKRLFPEMAYFLNMLNSYDLLKPKVEEMIKKIREDYKQNVLHGEKPVPPGFYYLIELERLRDLISVQTSKSAAEMLQEQFTTRNLERENAKNVERINEVSALLSEKKTRFDQDMLKKKLQLLKLQDDLFKCGKIAEANRKQTVRQSTYQMMRLTEAHKARNQILKQIELESRQGYDKFLNENVSMESNLRARRRKVEGQLKTFIAKYDADMAVKQRELDELEAQYNDEMEKCQDLELKLREQDAEFNPLMQEREEEYHAEMTEKMNAFMTEHAARVIQYSWRQACANRVEKYQLRKTLKKMQAAKENTENPKKKAKKQP